MLVGAKPLVADRAVVLQQRARNNWKEGSSCSESTPYLLAAKRTVIAYVGWIPSWPPVAASHVPQGLSTRSYFANQKGNFRVLSNIVGAVITLARGENSCPFLPDPSGGPRKTVMLVQHLALPKAGASACVGGCHIGSCFEGGKLP
jgi:hypothetical protein